jgi:hypothetical protein
MSLRFGVNSGASPDSLPPRKCFSFASFMSATADLEGSFRTFPA